MDNLTSTTPYVSGRWLARLTVIALILGIVLSLAAIFANFLQIRSITEAMVGPEITEDELMGGDLFGGSVAILHFLIFIATAVLFSMWLYRASRNLRALGTPKQNLEYSPGWAVGSFFVPILNLFVPFRAVKEIWVKSDPNVSSATIFSPQGSTIPAFIGWWWALWIISNIASRIVFRFSSRAETPEQILIAAKLEIGTYLLEITAAVFAVFLVQRIDARQEARSKRVTLLEVESSPPPLSSSLNLKNEQATNR